MHPGMQFDLFEQWLPRRPALMVAVGLWVAGFGMAGASAWRMHPQTVGVEMNGNGATPIDAVSDTAELEEAVFLPEDVVVGLRTPRIGVTLPQKR
jgi:hypothetical protein